MSYHKTILALRINTFYAKSKNEIIRVNLIYDFRIPILQIANNE